MQERACQMPEPVDVPEIASATSATRHGAKIAKSGNKVRRSVKPKTTAKSTDAIRHKVLDSTNQVYSIAKAAEFANVDVSALEGTSLVRPKELRALAKLVALNPTVAKRNIRKAASGKYVSFTNSLRTVADSVTRPQVENSDEHAIAYKEVARALNPAVNAIGRATDLCKLHGLPKELTKKLERLHQKLSLERDGCKQVAAIRSQPKQSRKLH